MDKVYDIFKKRKHVWVYDDKNIPSKETVNECLKKAWQLTPSKQQYMPYRVNVIGPGDEAEKERIWKQAIKNHHKVEDDAMKDGYLDHSKHTVNRNYQHIITAPYVFIFTSRVSESNEFNKMAIDEDSHHPEQEFEEKLEVINTLISFECGLFCATLTGLLCEKGLDVSFTSCFPKQFKKYWKHIPYVDQEPHIIMTTGVGKYFRWQFMERTKQTHLDPKPNFEKVVNWVVTNEDNDPEPEDLTKKKWLDLHIPGEKDGDFFEDKLKEK